MSRPRLPAPEALYLGSLLPPLVAVAALVWVRSWSLLVVLAVGAVAVLGIGGARWLAGRGWRGEWLLPVAILNVLVLTPELALRVTTVERRMGIRNAYLGSFQRLTPDDDLLWTFPAGSPGVNAFGFRGADITMPKPPGACRILYLGDSVEAQGYPRLVEARLRALEPTACVDTANLSLGGYSSYQGRVLADKFGVSLDPMSSSSPMGGMITGAGTAPVIRHSVERERPGGFEPSLRSSGGRPSSTHCGRRSAR